MRRTAVVAVAGALVACGSSAPSERERGSTALTPGSTPAPPEPVRTELPAEVRAFRDAFDPRWRSEPGSGRLSTTCAVADVLLARAEAIEGAPAPATVDGMTWADAAGALVSGVEALGPACAAGSLGGFDAAIVAAHADYDHLIVLLPAEGT